MMKFCFPERETENNDFNDRASEDGELEQKGKKTRGRRNRDSNFYVHIDDVEKMKVILLLNLKENNSIQFGFFFFCSGKGRKEQTVRLY